MTPAFIMQTPHPFPYQGSKRQLAPAILQYLPPDTHRLIEPFAGSAALSLAAIHRGCVQQVILNDTDVGLVRVWDAILSNPAQLADQYEQLWHAQAGQEKTFYLQVRERFNREHGAADYLYLLARCVKAAVRYNTAGDFNQSADNRRKGMHPKTMRQNLFGTASLLKDRSSLRQRDYTAILKLATSGDVIYLDPPYQGVCQQKDRRYRSRVLFDEFVEALCGLNARGLRYMVSYDGRTGAKVYGKPLPASLHLHRVDLPAGRSSQATLNGKAEHTVESLYLSPALWESVWQTASATTPTPLPMLTLAKSA